MEAAARGSAAVETSMEPETTDPSPAPRPRTFPCEGHPPGPRCGHTLTAINTNEPDFQAAKLVMFGEPCHPQLHLTPSAFFKYYIDLIVGVTAVHLAALVSKAVCTPSAKLQSSRVCAGGATALEGSRPGSQRGGDSIPASPGPSTSTG